MEKAKYRKDLPADVRETSRESAPVPKIFFAQVVPMLTRVRLVGLVPTFARPWSQSFLLRILSSSSTLPGSISGSVSGSVSGPVSGSSAKLVLAGIWKAARGEVLRNKPRILQISRLRLLLLSEMKFSEKGRICTETALETAQTRGEVPCILGLTHLAIRELV